MKAGKQLGNDSAGNMARSLNRSYGCRKIRYPVMSIRTQISDNAARLRALHAELHRAFLEDSHGPTHTAACAAFQRSYNALAFPGGLEHFFKRLKRLEPSAIDEAIEYLEADPWYFRSGYVKEEIVRRLKKAPITERQRHRLAVVILRSMATGTRRLARHLAKLAIFVDSPAFRSRIEAFSHSTDEVQHRAKHLLDVLRSQQVPD